MKSSNVVQYGIICLLSYIYFCHISPIKHMTSPNETIETTGCLQCYSLLWPITVRQRCKPHVRLPIKLPPKPQTWLLCRVPSGDHINTTPLIMWIHKARCSNGSLHWHFKLIYLVLFFITICKDTREHYHLVHGVRL